MTEARQPGLQDIAYGMHYQLIQHYSSQIFRARISITTLTLVVAGFALGVKQDVEATSTPILGIEQRPAVALLGATFIVLLWQMELGYLKRFYQVIKATRELEELCSLKSSYAKEYDSGGSIPIWIAYAFVVVLLVTLFVVSVFAKRLPLWFCVPAIVPLSGLLYTLIRVKRIPHYLRPSKKDETRGSQSGQEPAPMRAAGSPEDLDVPPPDRSAPKGQRVPP